MKFRIVIFMITPLWLWGMTLLIPFGPSWAAEGLFLAEKHKSGGIDCTGCHKESPPKQAVPTMICLECHGDYGRVAARTKKIDPNPHDSHLGETDCRKCHRAHSASVNGCNACHQLDLKVP
jgi:hypothetical protein